MPTLQLILAAAMTMQQSVATPAVAPALARAQAARAAARPALAALTATAPRLATLPALEGLAALDRLAVLDAADAAGAANPVAATAGVRSADQPVAQDPTDSLWRAARSALNRGEYESAANLYGDLMRRYPNSARAGDALYWAAFALYKTDDAANLDRARGLLVTQERRYPKAGTLHDANALLARIQTALAKQGDQQAAMWLAQHAQQARGGDTTPAHGCASGDEEDDMRLQALNGLLQMDAANAVPILRQVLARRDTCSQPLRRKAVFIVSQKHTSETEDILLDVVQHDPDAECREQAVFWLSQVSTDRAVTMLDSILLGTPDEALREKAIFALSQQQAPRARDILRAYAENPNAPADAREKAIFWLAQEHSRDNVAFLEALYAKLTDPDLKGKILFSLSQTGGTDTGPWLLEIALNEHEPIELRKKALFSAGQRGANLAQLTALYDRVQNTELKEQLIFVYAQRREAAAVDKLLDIAKREPDKELRKKAIFWLGQSHDPRAAQFLLEIINQ
jgi:TolA-binding protein